MQDIKNIKPEIWLIFILLFGLFLRLHFFIGLNWSDDVNYVDIANQILRGSYYPSYPNTLRLMIIYPIAFFFKIFGISNFSGALYPLICSLLSIISVFYFGKKFFGVKVGLLSAFILSFFPLDVNYSTWIMGDVPIGFFTALSVFLFFLAESNKKKYFYFFSRYIYRYSLSCKTLWIVTSSLFFCLFCL